MASRKELLDELLKDYQTPEDLLGKNGLVKQLTKDLIERALEAELTDHLGYDKHAADGRGSGNSRNGTSGKTLKTEQGDLPLEIRPLDAVYPIVNFDALRVKIRTDHTVTNQAVYLALGVNIEGEKELLGLWIAQTEGAKFWLGVLNELKNRGVDDLFIACVDGLTGFPEAVEAAFPQTQVQLCIVHMVRNSPRYVPWKQRKAVAADLKSMYHAASVKEAETQLTAFEEKWDAHFPTISQSWRQHWPQIIPFFASPDIRRGIYTTNAIESLNSKLRKIIKTRRVFPSEEAATKLLYLALQNIAKKWTKPIKNWRKALNQFAIFFEGRVPTQ
jgi:putative transposase